MINKLLEENNIKFETQKKFNNCKFKYKLAFDFYLIDFNILIEYDGIQHYKPVEQFGGEKSLKYLQNNDNIKTKYCIDNNIELIRIKYNDKLIHMMKNLFIKLLN